jgi:hypothetical protein
VLVQEGVHSIYGLNRSFQLLRRAHHFSVAVHYGCDVPRWRHLLWYRRRPGPLHDWNPTVVLRATLHERCFASGALLLFMYQLHRLLGPGTFLKQEVISVRSVQPF